MTHQTEWTCQAVQEARPDTADYREHLFGRDQRKLSLAGCSCPEGVFDLTDCAESAYPKVRCGGRIGFGEPARPSTSRTAIGWYALERGPSRCRLRLAQHAMRYSSLRP